jgi:hypothetical protein
MVNQELSERAEFPFGILGHERLVFIAAWWQGVYPSCPGTLAFDFPANSDLGSHARSWSNSFSLPSDLAGNFENFAEGIIFDQAELSPSFQSLGILLHGKKRNIRDPRQLIQSNPRSCTGLEG